MSVKRRVDWIRNCCRGVRKHNLRGGVLHSAKGWCIGRVRPWATTAEGQRRLEAEFATLVARTRRDEVLRRYHRALNMSTGTRGAAGILGQCGARPKG